jgi:hypothetical protein
MLDKAFVIYRNRYTMAVNERDRTYLALVNHLGGEESFLKFKQKYYNKQLAMVVTNEKEIQQFTVHDGEMIPIKDAVYRLPEGNSWRAHFYAPVKMVLNRQMGTFWFNLLFIWIFSALLLGLLYYDIIRKGLNYLETLRLNRLNNLRLNRLIKIAEQNRPVRTRR